MNNDQEFTPKYWVAQVPYTDDVIIATASKSWCDTLDKLKTLDKHTDDYEIVLIEIRLVVP